MGAGADTMGGHPCECNQASIQADTAKAQSGRMRGLLCGRRSGRPAFCPREPTTISFDQHHPIWRSERQLTSSTFNSSSSGRSSTCSDGPSSWVREVKPTSKVNRQTFLNAATRDTPSSTKTNSLVSDILRATRDHITVCGRRAVDETRSPSESVLGRMRQPSASSAGNPSMEATPAR